MKIALNARFLLKGRIEGIGKYTYETMKRLVEWHPEHEFIFFFDRKYDSEFIFADNVTPVVLFPQARHPVLFYWWFEYSVSRALKKYRADAFISPDGFLSLKTSVPTLLVVHDISFKHFPDQVRRMEKWYYQRFMSKFITKAKRLVTVSKHSRMDIIKHYNVSKEKIAVTYNAGDSIYQPLSTEDRESIKLKYAEGKEYFIYVGSLHPRKNLVRLIRAFSKFKETTSSDLKLLLAGRMAWQTGDIYQTYKESEFQSDIHFLGYQETPELARILASSFAMVYVSILEGFGIPILDAMHCDVPVITSNTSSMPEVAGEAALLADPFSIDSISEKMIEIAENKELRERLVSLGRSQRTKFSWDNTAKKLWESLEKITPDSGT